MTTEFQALENLTNTIGLSGLQIVEKQQSDKRHTTKKFFLCLNYLNISPVLDYEQMNHFILGFKKCYELKP